MGEDLDFNHLVDCPHCKNPIPYDATMCLYCGESVDCRNNKSWIIALAIALIIILLLTFVF